MPIPRSRLNGHGTNGKALPSSPEVNGRKERLALHLGDVEAMEPFFRQRYLGGRVEEGKPVCVGIDSRGGKIGGIVLVGSLISSALVVDLIRSEDRRLMAPATRAYLQRGAWSQLPALAVLTVLDAEGQPKLSPEWFPSKPVPAPHDGPVAVAVDLGEAF